MAFFVGPRGLAARSHVLRGLSTAALKLRAGVAQTRITWGTVLLTTLLDAERNRSALFT